MEERNGHLDDHMGDAIRTVDRWGCYFLLALAAAAGGWWVWRLVQ